MNRLEYLEWYNTQDVIIMCPIIDFLIHKFQEFDVDMLRNISLSSCTDQVKFALAYKDFNIIPIIQNKLKLHLKSLKNILRKNRRI
jgi:hypothetical protein